MDRAEFPGVAAATTDSGTPRSYEPQPDVRARAVATIAGALGAGAITEALVWNARIGLSFFIVDVLLVVGAFGVIGSGRRPSSGALFFAFAAIAGGAAVVWYASDWALTSGVCTALSSLIALPFAVHGRWRLDDLGRVLSIPVDAARRTPAALTESARLPARALDQRGRSQAWSLVKGLTLGLPLALFFVGLLAADPGFARAVNDAVMRSGEAVQFAIATFGAGAAFLVARVLFAKRDEDAPLPAVCEEPLRPYRQPNEPSLALATVPLAEATPEPIVRPIAWAAVLVQLIAVFGVFAVVNATSLFGGHALVHAPGPLTYARYLHAGFTQLSIAALLAVVTVLIGHVVLRRRGEPSISPVPGGAAIATLEAILLGLVAVVLASCTQRLFIYEDAYGFTYERLFVGFFQIGVLGMLVLTFVKAVARGFRHYAASAVFFLTALAVCMSWFDADGTITQRQLARAAAGHTVDWNYLSSLSEDPLARIDLRSAGPYRALVEDAWVEQRAEHLYDGWRSVRGLRNAL